jgi:hypothetical protein
VAHGGALFADAVHAHYGTQPHLERHGWAHRDLPGVSGLGRAYPAASRHRGTDPPGQRFQHLLAGQEPQCSRGGCRRGWRPQRLAARPGIRALLRIPGR